MSQIAIRHPLLPVLLCGLLMGCASSSSGKKSSTRTASTHRDSGDDIQRKCNMWFDNYLQMAVNEGASADELDQGRRSRPERVGECIEKSRANPRDRQMLECIHTATTKADYQACERRLEAQEAAPGEETDATRFTYCCSEDCDPNGDPEMLLNPDFRAAGQRAAQACLNEGGGQDACLSHGHQTCMGLCTSAPDPCP